MKNRNPLLVVVFTIITLGIYGIVWQVKTKNEMNKLGNTIPTAWLIIVPFVNIYWLWLYCKGVDNVSKNKLSAPLSFVLLFFLGVIGMAIIQNTFNGISGGVGEQANSFAGPAPDASFGGPAPTAPAATFAPTAPTAPTEYVAPTAPVAPTTVVSSENQNSTPPTTPAPTV